MKGESLAGAVVILLCLWLALALAVAAGMVLGAWVLMQYLASAMQGLAS